MTEDAGAAVPPPYPGRPLFDIRGVSKRYGGVRALQDASLAIQAARIHAVLGENGAGKSTLIKIMAGVVAPDEGRMLLDGAPVQFESPSDAQAAGIACIFQELSLIPDLSVADNICISDPPRRLGLIDRGKQRRIAEDALARSTSLAALPIIVLTASAVRRERLRGTNVVRTLKKPVSLEALLQAIGGVIRRTR